MEVATAFFCPPLALPALVMVSVALIALDAAAIVALRFELVLEAGLAIREVEVTVGGVGNVLDDADGIAGIALLTLTSFPSFDSGFS